MSPGCASSGKITISSPTAQLALLTSVTDHMPSFSLTRSERPAQLGQLKVSPRSIPSGTAIFRPQSLQNAVRILSSGEQCLLCGTNANTIDLVTIEQ